jgi:hypothetical protein
MHDDWLVDSSPLDGTFFGIVNCTSTAAAFGCFVPLCVALDRLNAAEFTGDTL